MQVDDEIALGEGLERQGAHPGVEEVARLEEAGEVVEDVLDVGVGAEPDDGDAGGLRLGRDHRERFPDQGVHQ